LYVARIGLTINLLALFIQRYSESKFKAQLKQIHTNSKTERLIAFVSEGVVRTLQVSDLKIQFTLFDHRPDEEMVWKTLNVHRPQ
jgi:hypothetical protein